MNQAKISNLYKGPFIYASYHVSVHLAKRLQRRIFFRTQPIRNKNCLWWPCLLTDHDEMSIFKEDLPYMLSTQFRFIWPCSFRGEDFQKSANQKQKLHVQPCLLSDRDEMNNLYRGPYIDASYLVFVHLAKGFQRIRLKCEKLTDRQTDRQRTK